MNFKRAIITLMVLMLLPGLAMAQDGAGDTARFEVNKLWVDYDLNLEVNDATVDVEIVCNTGLPLTQEATISSTEGVVFVVAGLLDLDAVNCTISEKSVPAGYKEWSTSNLGDLTEGGCLFVGGIDGNALEFNECDLYNQLLPVTVVVGKQWELTGSVGEDVDTDITIEARSENRILLGYRCFNGEGPVGDGGFDPDWCIDLDFDGNGLRSFEVVPSEAGTDVYLYEDIDDSAVEASNTCGGGMTGMVTVYPGQGAACTFTNTVFFEGIPTLSQYGLAIMALLMLGVGFVGFRRFV